MMWLSIGHPLFCGSVSWNDWHPLNWRWVGQMETVRTIDWRRIDGRIRERRFKEGESVLERSCSFVDGSCDGWRSIDAVGNGGLAFPNAPILSVTAPSSLTSAAPSTASSRLVANLSLTLFAHRF